MTNIPEPRQADESFSTTVCPNCGYSLVGLSREGVCPECGVNYDQSELILYGSARGQFENAMTAKGNRLVWIILSSCGFAMLSLVQFQNMLMWANLIVVAAPVVYLLYRRQSVQHPGQVQIRLSDRGCVQYNDLSAQESLQDLLQPNQWWIGAALVCAAIFTLLCGYVFSPWPYITLFVGSVAVVAGWKSSRKYRAAMRDIPDNAIAERNRIRTNYTAWNKVQRFSLVKASKMTYRMQIETSDPGLWFQEYRLAVDAEIQFNEKQLESVRERLNRWISASRTS